MTGARIADESADYPGTWAQMGPSERLGVMAQGFFSADSDVEKQSRIMLRVREHFGPDGPQDFFDATNVLLREASREQHGSTDVWDASLKASGKSLSPSAIDALMLRKRDMTAEEFEAAYARLHAPHTQVVGLVRWKGAVTRPGDVERVVAVEFPHDDGVATVKVDGRKVNAKQRRRWLDLLAQKGVTRQRVVDGVTSGAQRISHEDDEGT